MTLTTRNRTDNQNYATTQTAGKTYEALLKLDTAINCPFQRKLTLSRCCIPEPPRLMRNIPKFYTANKLLPIHALKFDIRTPGPSRKIWRRKQYAREAAIRECILGTTERTSPETPAKTFNKRTMGATDGRTKKRKIETYG